jgi:hypothetical protein
LFQSVKKEKEEEKIQIRSSFDDNWIPRKTKQK